jgi:hypothetical protein
MVASRPRDSRCPARTGVETVPHRLRPIGRSSSVHAPKGGPRRRGPRPTAASNPSTALIRCPRQVPREPGLDAQNQDDLRARACAAAAIFDSSYSAGGRGSPGPAHLVTLRGGPRKARSRTAGSPSLRGAAIAAAKSRSTSSGSASGCPAARASSSRSIRPEVRSDGRHSHQTWPAA